MLLTTVIYDFPIQVDVYWLFLFVAWFGFGIIPRRPVTRCCVDTRGPLEGLCGTRRFRICWCPEAGTTRSGSGISETEHVWKPYWTTGPMFTVRACTRYLYISLHCIHLARFYFKIHPEYPSLWFFKQLLPMI